MASLYLIVPVAILFCAVAVAAWLWASRSGQFDDLDREARRILEDEDECPPPALLADRAATARASTDTEEQERGC